MGKFCTGDFDQSGKGKSALIAAACTGLQAEVLNYTEEQVIGAFHDFAQFFDTIDINILIEKAKEADFPILDLCITLMQHMAPRIIQCKGYCSRTIITNQSILAGCKHSVGLTRVFFLTGMLSLCLQNPKAQPSVFVVDTAMLTSGDICEATDNMLQSVMNFVDRSKKPNLKLSTKGVIISKDKRSTKLIINEFDKIGITYQQK